MSIQQPFLYNKPKEVQEVWFMTQCLLYASQSLVVDAADTVIYNKIDVFIFTKLVFE